MASKVLDKAKHLLRNRRFTNVIALLEPLVVEYRESFQFFYMLGIACLYVGDNGGAESYFRRARQLRVRDPNLQMAQVALFMRRGEVDRAVEYCLDVLDYAPSNKQAKKTLQLIRDHGDSETIAEWIQNDKIKKFYPSLGVKPSLLLIPVFTVVALACVYYFAFVFKLPQAHEGNRADLTEFVLSVGEKKSMTEDKGIFRYELTDKDVLELYEKIQKSFQKYEDNNAQVACNMLLNSNAADAVKIKVRMLSEYLWKPKPTFDSLVVNFDYEEVAKEPYQYEGCYVIWNGRVGNINVETDRITASFLVGYDTLTKVSGVIPIELPAGLEPDSQKPLRILGRLSMVEDKMVLRGFAIYQPLTTENF